MIRRRTFFRSNIFFCLAAVCTLVLADGCAENYVERGGTLRLAQSRQVAGNFVVGGERYGFAADLVDTMAQRYGKQLVHTTGHTIEEIKAGLDSGRIDLATILTTDRVKLHRYPSERLYTTQYVVMMPSWKSVADTLSAAELCRGARIATDLGFRHTAAFAELSTDGQTKIDTTLHDGDSMARKLLRGGCDAIVCEKSEAELVEVLYRGLRSVAAFDESVEVRLIFRDMRLKRSFGAVLLDFSTTDDYVSMAELYFGPTSVAQRFDQLRYKPTRVVGGISVWDDQIRPISERVGVDWRLMSAMALYESNFRTDLVSEAGAVGLMQVTPIVAAEFGMEGCDLADTHTNILLAAKLLRKNSRALGFGNQPTNFDQAAIVVASYHCGITRTMEAQRLVVAEGGDSGSWEAVSRMMRNMGDSEWIEASDCRFGRFRDWAITLAYTNRVVEQYKTYCSSLPA